MGHWPGRGHRRGQPPPQGLQFAGDHLLPALAAFNLGIELGRLLALLVALPLLRLLQRASAMERCGAIVIAALVGHAARHWMEKRAGAIPLAELAADLAALDPLRAAAWAATALVVVLAARLIGGLWRPPADGLRLDRPR